MKPPAIHPRTPRAAVPCRPPHAPPVHVCPAYTCARAPLHLHTCTHARAYVRTHAHPHVRVRARTPAVRSAYNSNASPARSCLYGHLRERTAMPARVWIPPTRVNVECCCIINRG